MTLLRMTFAGQIKKADHKNVGGKALVEVSICKKQKGRNGAEDTFTWLRIAIWEPADWLAPKLVKGAFIAGSGEFTSRSYDGKDGKATSMEVRCGSYDVEVDGGGGGTQAGPPRDMHEAVAAVKEQRAAVAAPDYEQPPF